MDEFDKLRESGLVNSEILDKTFQFFKTISDGIQNEHCKWLAETISLINVYLEEAYIGRTIKYYRDKDNKLVQFEDKIKFVETVLMIYDIEGQLVRNYMHSSFENMINFPLSIIFLQDNPYTVIARDLGDVSRMIYTQNFDQLKLLYCLYSRYERDLSQIVFEFKEYFKDLINVNIYNREQEATCIASKLIKLQNEADQIIKSCFQDNSKFRNVIQNSCRDMICSFSGIEQDIAENLDEFVIKYIKSPHQYNLKESLKLNVWMLSHLKTFSNRNKFIKAYSEFLGERLLNRKLLNIQVEKDMISELKTAIDHYSLDLLSIMIKDIELSCDTVGEFRQQISDDKKDIDFDISLVSPHFYSEQDTPLEQKLMCNIPYELENIQRDFEVFYKNKHEHRHLTWINASTAEIDTLCFSEKYTLKASFYQTMILMIFNMREKLTVKELKEMKELSGISCEELLFTHLKELCHPNMRLILKDNSNSQEFALDENLEINEDFTAQFAEIELIPKINKTKKSDTTTDNQNQEILEIDKKCRFKLRAEITKIMKHSIKKSHQNLLVEVKKQMGQFKPDLAMIIEAIEYLICNDYIKKDENDSQAYIYLP